MSAPFRSRSAGSKSRSVSTVTRVMSPRPATTRGAVLSTLVIREPSDTCWACAGALSASSSVFNALSMSPPHDGPGRRFRTQQENVEFGSQVQAVVHEGGVELPHFAGRARQLSGVTGLQHFLPVARRLVSQSSMSCGMQRLPDGPAEIGESAYDRGGRPQAPPRILADQANAHGGRPVGGRSIKSPQVTVRARQAPVEGLHMRMAKRAHGLSSRKHPGSATVTDMDLGAVAQ